ISANFLGGQTLTDVSASLVKDKGSAVAHWLSTPGKPLAGSGGYNQIIVLPKQPLDPATAYTVTMRANVDCRPWWRTWSFQTTDPERYYRRMSQLLLERINTARERAGAPKVEMDAELSRGCQAHARYAVRNLDHPKVQGLGIHEEDASLPGATP